MIYSDEHPVIQLDEGWDDVILKAGLVPLELTLEKGIKTSKGLFKNAEYASIYTVVIKMCCQQAPHNWSAELYQRHGEYLTQYLSQHVYKALQGLQGQHLLEELVRRNGNHAIMNKWLRHFFRYLDRFHVDHNSLPPLLDTGIIKFKELVFDLVKVSACDAILVLINQERDGGSIDRTLVDNCVKIYDIMGMRTHPVYEEDFERHLISGAQGYYSSKSNEWLEIDSTPTYMFRAEKALNEEAQRVRQYLLPETETKLLSAVEKELLGKREQELLEKEGSGCRVMLKNDQTEDLARMYRLFSRVPNGIPPMADIFRHHIIDLGEGILQARQARIDADKAKESNDDPDFIKELLNIHDLYLGMISKHMNNDANFQKALKDAFTEVVNRTLGKFPSAELLSTFCDRILKGKEKLNEEEAESFLERTVQLFSYLSDKDIFAEIYRNQLSKRLLNQKSASDDMEKTMIAKLKLKCGNTFTAKMEGMLADLILAGETANTFEEYYKENRINHHGNMSGQISGIEKLDMSVQQLTEGHWPKPPKYDIKLPAVMNRAKEIYESFHKVKFSGRRVAWYYGLGNATVKGSFQGGKKTHDLKITTLQAVLLLAFNAPADGEYLSFQQLMEITGMSDEVLKRVSHSLSSSKVLKKKSVDTAANDKVIRDTDSFCFNDAYSSPKKVVVIPMASLDEGGKSRERIEVDRSHTIEASIVRTMKARKTLGHEQLVAEVLTQLAFFKPERRVIKKRIEALISREYLARNPKDPSMYDYMA